MLSTSLLTKKINLPFHVKYILKTILLIYQA